jgi:hypothetical protein
VGTRHTISIVTPYQFRPEGPPALDSVKYAEHYNELKAFGASSSTVRTPEQTEIALFWADGAGTETPPGHWNSIAAFVAAARRNSMEENARLFALLNVAMADAAIAAWDAKYAYNFRRPITAIANGALDGNDATVADTAWTPADRDAALPRLCVGPQHLQCCRRASAGANFWQRRRRLYHGIRFPPGCVPVVCQLLRGRGRSGD